MTKFKIATTDIILDENGRVVLDDDSLQALLQHNPQLTFAAGSNSGCVNSGCSSPTQVNSGCTNYGCSNNMNTRCTNNVSGD